jgi:hypothetical protein
MFKARPGKSEFPSVKQRFSLSGVCLYEREGVLESLREREDLARQGSNRLMVGPHKEDGMEPQQRPHVFRGIIDFLAQFSRTQIHLFHFFGCVATDGH